MLAFVGFFPLIYMYHYSKRTMYVPVIYFAFFIFAAQFLDLLVPGGIRVIDSGIGNLIMIIGIISLFGVAVIVMLFLRASDRRREGFNPKLKK